MIDTPKLHLPLKHTPFGGRVHETSPGKEPRTYRRRQRVEVGHSHQAIHVTSLKDGEELKFENSFLGAVQGHNCCGSNNLRAITRIVCQRAFDELGLKVGARKLETALDDASLKKLDIAVNFRCNGEDQKAALLKTVAELIRSTRHSMVRTYGDETAYISANGVMVCFYNKAREISANKWRVWQEHQFEGRKAIKRYAENLMRVEVRMDRPWLAKHNLTNLNDWNANTVRRVVSAELEGLDLTRPVKSFDPKTCGDLSRAHMRYVMAHYSGIPVSSGYGSRSERQLRRELTDKKLLWSDLGNFSGLIVSDVGTLLSPDRMLVSYPRELKEKGLILVPEGSAG